MTPISGSGKQRHLNNWELYGPFSFVVICFLVNHAVNLLSFKTTICMIKMVRNPIFAPVNSIWLSSTAINYFNLILTLTYWSDTSLSQLLPRERKKHEYLESVKNLYKHLPEVKRIIRYIYGSHSLLSRKRRLWPWYGLLKQQNINWSYIFLYQWIVLFL